MRIVLDERPASLPLSIACDAIGLNRSSVYAFDRRRRHRLPANRSRKDCHQPRALSNEERQVVLNTLNSEQFRDQPPAEVHARLLDQGKYIGSVSTMHRILAAENQQGERRAQRPAQHHAIPRLSADRPNKVWVWDITKLPTLEPSVYLSLYVVMDLFSRFVLAWMISTKENSALAQQLMQEATARYAIGLGELTIHQDRGAPMIAHAYLDTMAELGVSCSHSRPRVSNDNPFIESHFKTLKYQPDYPGRFLGPEPARLWHGAYFDWYNFDHHHSGLNGYTPEQVFTDRYQVLAERKQQVLDAHFDKHSERFVRGRPKAPLPPAVVTINPIVGGDQDEPISNRVNFPTLPAAAHALANQIDSGTKS